VRLAEFAAKAKLCATPSSPALSNFSAPRQTRQKPPIACFQSILAKDLFL
jgi:hypothetical protein